jgi:hypothetical protein
VDKIITISRFANTKNAIAAIFAVNNFSRVTGRVRVIFILFCENSPVKISTATKAVNKGRIVFTNTDRTVMGNSRLLTPLIPKPFRMPMTISWLKTKQPEKL